MKKSWRWVVLALLFCTPSSPSPAATPQLVSATYLGTAGDDDLQDAAIAEDGTIYVVGNVDRPLAGLPGGVQTVTLGKPV
ncbi:MAG TPA: hypothetical protein VMY42_09735, partial [Thermoguttaceae bacterium]|nr:hypothetical protein [Thermoguttaceae bacterium]